MAPAAASNWSFNFSIFGQMAALLFLGCLLVAYGPSVAVLLGFVSQRAQLLILTIGRGIMALEGDPSPQACSAFIWLLSILLNSVVWVAIPPIKDVLPFHVVVGVLLQEALRFVALKYYIKGEPMVLQVLPSWDPMGINDLSSSIAAGLGYAIMQGVVLFGSILSYSRKDEILVTDNCTEMNLYVLSAILCLLFSLAHLVWMPLALDAFRRQSWVRGAVVVVSHMGMSLLVRFVYPCWSMVFVPCHTLFGAMVVLDHAEQTLLNEHSGGCVPVVSFLSVFVVLLLIWVVRVVLARDYHALLQATQRVTGTGNGQPEMQMASVPSRNSVARRVSVARSSSADGGDS